MIRLTFMINNGQVDFVGGDLIRLRAKEHCFDRKRGREKKEGIKKKKRPVDGVGAIPISTLGKMKCGFFSVEYPESILGPSNFPLHFPFPFFFSLAPNQHLPQGLSSSRLPFRCLVLLCCTIYILYYTSLGRSAAPWRIKTKFGVTGCFPTPSFFDQNLQ